MDCGQSDVFSSRVFTRDTKVDNVLIQYQGVDSDVEAISKLVTSNNPIFVLLSECFSIATTISGTYH